jgi:hypothetical protein
MKFTPEPRTIVNSLTPGGSSNSIKEAPAPLVELRGTPSIVLETEKKRFDALDKRTGIDSLEGFVIITVPVPALKLRLAPLYDVERIEFAVHAIAPTIRTNATSTFQLIFICIYSCL